MSEKQEIAPSKRKLSKAFLIIGIVLLVSSLFLFYLASVNDIDFAATYLDTVNLREAGSSYPYDFGLAHHYPIKPYMILMQPNDYLTISVNAWPANGTVYVVLWDEDWSKVLKYSSTLYASSAFLDFKTSDKILVEGYVASQNPNNTISVETTLHHYERPQWVLFGIGVVTASLAPLAVFKSKR